jgi:1,4-alpha-glucan branching enzyme
VRPAVPGPTADPPYEVVHDGVLIGDSDVVAYARDLSVAYHVWSPTAATRATSGTATTTPAAPSGCTRRGGSPTTRCRPTARPLRTRRARRPGRSRVTPTTCTACCARSSTPGPAAGRRAYDTELFGHWWFEGVDWLEALLRRVAADPR